MSANSWRFLDPQGWGGGGWRAPRASQKDVGGFGANSQRFLDSHARLQVLGVRQHAVFTPAQLEAIGIKRDASRQRVRAQRLFRVHHGVYSLVPADLLSQNGRFLAAVLACGPGAVLSHRSAAALLDLRATERQGIDVSVTTTGTRTHAGIDVHRSRRRHHFTTGSFESDRERDQRCVAAGWRVVRVTRRQVAREPERIADLLVKLLARTS